MILWLSHGVPRRKQNNYKTKLYISSEDFKYFDVLDIKETIYDKLSITLRSIPLCIAGQLYITNRAALL